MIDFHFGFNSGMETHASFWENRSLAFQLLPVQNQKRADRNGWEIPFNFQKTRTGPPAF